MCGDSGVHLTNTHSLIIIYIVCSVTIYCINYLMSDPLYDIDPVREELVNILG